MTTRWYCMQIMPQFQDKVEFHLKNQEFDFFFPQVMMPAGVYKGVIARPLLPMFKGYGFVAFDIERDRWLSVNGTFGVIKLVPKHSLMPVPMRPGLVEQLRKRNPIPEEDLLEIIFDMLDEFYPGLTIQVKEALNSDGSLDPNSKPVNSLLAGRRGVVLTVREKLLEISFLLLNGTGNSIWVDKNSVLPLYDEPTQESRTDTVRDKRHRLKDGRRAVAIQKASTS